MSAYDETMMADDEDGLNTNDWYMSQIPATLEYPPLPDNWREIWWLEDEDDPDEAWRDMYRVKYVCYSGPSAQIQNAICTQLIRALTTHDAELPVQQQSPPPPPPPRSYTERQPPPPCPIPKGHYPTFDIMSDIDFPKLTTKKNKKNNNNNSLKFVM